MKRTEYESHEDQVEKKRNKKQLRNDIRYGENGKVLQSAVLFFPCSHVGIFHFVSFDCGSHARFIFV